MAPDPWTRWQQLVADHPLPEWVHEASPASEVVPGQIWAAYWGNHEQLVVPIDSPDEVGDVRVAPVTFEPGVEADGSLVYEPDVSPFHVATVVWIDMSVKVSVGVLDRVVGDSRIRLDTTGVDQIPGVRPGVGSPSPQSPAALVIADIADSVEALQGMPKPDLEASPAKRLPVDLRTVVEVLDVDQPRAMAIILRKEPLSSQEAEQLSLATGMAISELTANALPAELQLELLNPRWRRLVRTYSKDSNDDELVARKALGYEAYGLAAREDHPETGRWPERLRAIEESQQGAPR